MSKPVPTLRECPNPWCESHTRPDRNYAPFINPSRASYEKAVSCPVCPMRGPWANTEAEAIAAWNTRTADQHIERLTSALENIANADNCPFNLAVHARAALSLIKEGKSHGEG